MFRTVCCLPLLLVMIGAASGAPPEVQPEYKVTAGQNLRILVKGKDLDYKTTFTDEEAFFDQLVSPKDGEYKFVFQAPKDGVYYVVFWTCADKGSGTLVKITVGTPTPKPPAPQPPAPGPQPSVELKRKIFEATAKDKADRADVVQLAALYREVSKLCVKKSNDTFEAGTSRELLRRMRETGNALIGPDAMLGTRTVAAEELALVFGSPSDVPLTDLQRSQGADALLRLAAALDAAIGG